MAVADLRSEERIGLILAVIAHAGLLALLVLHPPKPPTIPPPERMTVTLSDNVGLTSTSPEPQAQAAPDMAPMIGEVPEPEPAAQPLPQPAPIPAPQPRVEPLPKLSPKPVAKPSAAPAPRASQKPPVKKPGASRIGSDFLPGVPGAQASGASRNPPAAAIGPQIRASFAQSVLRQVKPNWQGRVPQGVNTEKLVTILSIELNRDGTLSSPPRVLGQEGIDESNRAQAQRHEEAAIKAVQLSAPFNLPPELYDGWKRLPPLRFRKSS